MGVQTASEKRRNPWTSQAARDRRSEIGVPSERRMSQTVCSRKKRGQAHDGLGGRGGAVAVFATTRRARGVLCSARGISRGGRGIDDYAKWNGPVGKPRPRVVGGPRAQLHVRRRLQERAARDEGPGGPGPSSRPSQATATPAPWPGSCPAAGSGDPRTAAAPAGSSRCSRPTPSGRARTPRCSRR
jgi:hypothetical protein